MIHIETRLTKPAPAAKDHPDWLGGQEDDGEARQWSGNASFRSTVRQAIKHDLLATRSDLQALGEQRNKSLALSKPAFPKRTAFTGEAAARDAHWPDEDGPATGQANRAAPSAPGSHPGA
ncbi:hypothetical protein MRS44_001491 [Fusarium solani]|uniref:uncharacterized protein n=1 Tax=Fusarium solani TaxID=169388 RepID=UPI0032C4869C|nr:hypothetical protein MRS44_001491 [Fusarium solani]